MVEFLFYVAAFAVIIPAGVYIERKKGSRR